MLKIQCNQCGKTLMGKDTIATSIDAYIGGVKYQDYAVTCVHCGAAVRHERFAKKAAENKAKAMAKAMRKTGKSANQITEEQQYKTIMLKAYKRAQKMAKQRLSNKHVKWEDIDAAVNELPADEKRIVLAYEDKQNMLILKNGTNKPTAHIGQNAILLLTQALIQSARDDEDEDFLQSEYGAYVADVYNLALTHHTKCDYGITAEVFMEQWRKGEWQKRGEDEDV